MTVYQIKVKGKSATTDYEFNCRSRKIYQHVPTQKEIDEFIEVCRDNSYRDYLDGEPKEIDIMRLELIH